MLKSKLSKHIPFSNTHRTHLVNGTLHTESGNNNNYQIWIEIVGIVLCASVAICYTMYRNET